MYRYIALVWKEEDAAAVSAAEALTNKINKEPMPWQTVYNNHGLIVLQKGESKGRMQAYDLENGAGVILGKLFNKSPCGDHCSIDKPLSEDASQKIITTEGKHLVEHYWGRCQSKLKLVKTVFKNKCLMPRMYAIQSSFLNEIP